MKSALDNLVDYNVLWLGRHVALSTHQVKYGHQIAGALTEDLDFIGDKPKPGRISNIIFAVTSGNQHLLRDNPIGFADRIVPLNDLGRLLEDNYDVTYSVVSIPHFPQIHNWPEVVTKIVSRHYGLGDKPFFNPDNMIFLGSTPAIVRLFQMEGYSVLGSELISLQPEPKYCARNPWDILMEAIKIPNINKIPDLSSYTKRWWHQIPKF